MTDGGEQPMADGVERGWHEDRMRMARVIELEWIA